MAEMARLVKVEQDEVIKQLKSQVEEALGLRGVDKSGSIKATCLEAVSTQFKEMNKNVKADVRECYKKCADQANNFEALKESLNKWREVQDKNTEVIADLQRKTLAERKATEELMNHQRDKFSSATSELKVEIDRIKESITRHKGAVERRLEVLAGFGASIKSNLSKIDQNTALCKRALEQVEAFRSDDMFVNCQGNYLKVYQELMKQRQVLEYEFRPLIKQTAIDKTVMVRVDDHDQTKARVNASEQALRDVVAELARLEEDKVGLAAKVEYLESQTPARRKRKGPER